MPANIGNPFGPVPGPDALSGQDTGEGTAGVRGINVDPGGIGVKGFGGNGALGFLGGKDPQFHQHAGVYGESDQQGVVGHATTDTGTGVFGNSPGGGFGVRGESVNGTGVQGQSFGNGMGMSGISDQGHGVHGQNGKGSGLRPDVGTGVLGESDNGFGVYASSGTNVGVFGESQTTNGVLGVTHSDSVAAVSGVNKSGGIGIFGEGKIAGFFAGDVNVTGDISLVHADCAEDFDISGAEKVEPGTVMVIDQEGALQVSQQAYDKKVAGVISGAGDYKPAITLDKQQVQGNRMPIALLGKVYCKVDAQYSPIEVGDLLTTSPTPGHAMKTDDPLKAFGAVIGKALRPLKTGQGLIPILIALQ
jgi:hypothetical protein